MMNVALDIVSVLILYLLLVTGYARHAATMEMGAMKAPTVVRGVVNSQLSTEAANA